LRLFSISCAIYELSASVLVGSATKDEATAKAHLVATSIDENQSLALDDSVARFLPKTGDVWRDVTIRMLLCHRSGIPDYTSLERFPSEISKIDRNPMELSSWRANYGRTRIKQHERGRHQSTRWHCRSEHRHDRPVVLGV
jgi:CubicO group peptidase (beta-lactamase class C family)